MTVLRDEMWGEGSTPDELHGRQVPAADLSVLLEGILTPKEVVGNANRTYTAND